MERMEAASPSSAPSKPPKRIKGPREDAWLRTFDTSNYDRSLLDSVRRGHLNPDLIKLRHQHCSCGSEVHVEDNWYVMTQDGTLVCNSCAQCNCCGRESVQISRRLVSIDGMVLCYRCVKFFGHPHRAKLQMRVEQLTTKNPLSTPKEGDSSTGTATPPVNLSNSEYYDYNVPRENRLGFNPKLDMRRLIRPRYYDPPVMPLARLDDWTLVPPAYLAENTHQPAMVCPACNSTAFGIHSYVVPAMARVYHKRCFRCCNCKESLAYGYKVAGFSFEYCSCEAPQVWCTKRACRLARFAHHKVGKCHLGCIRPGGRIQNDTTVEPSAAEQSHRRKRGKHSHVKEQQPASRSTPPASRDVSNALTITTSDGLHDATLADA